MRTIFEARFKFVNEILAQRKKSLGAGKSYLPPN